MKRYIYIILSLLLLLATGALLIFWPEQDDLSALVDVGAAYDARILRDTWGVPHIFGESDADAAYGLAFAHAEDDFLTIQQTALAARGELATVYGPDAAPNDYMVQLLRIWDNVDSQYEQLSPELRALCEAYAAGLNQYAALHEDDALPGLFPLTGKDVVAGAVHKAPLFFGLDQTLTELFADERQNTVSPRYENGFAPDVQSSEVTPKPDASSPFFGHVPIPAHLGSNTFAVSPDRSANGETFLAVNAHQPWTGPVAWYEAHVHSEEGWDMVGALFPGMPVLAHGHNRHLGWAFTVNRADRADVFVLDVDPDDPMRYRFDGEWRVLERRDAPIRVKLLGRLRWTVQEEVLWSVYGPVVRRDHGTYAIRFAGMGRIGLFEQLYRLNKASSFVEWQEAMRLLELPTFNTGYADQEGNIYYLYNGLLPQRDPHYDWQQYLPGDTSETLWTDYLPFEQLPQVLNPASGFVVNTNHTPFAATVGPENPDPTTFPPSFGIETELNNRAMRALALFGEDPAITEEEFYAYKYDMAYAPDSQIDSILQRLFVAQTPDETRYQSGLLVLRDWDLAVTPDSRGAALAILTAYLLDYRQPEEMTDAEIVAGFTEAVDLMLRRYGGLDVPWSSVNRLRRGEVDLGVGGGPDILHAIYGELGDDGRLEGRQGDSYVLLVTWDADGVVSSRSIHQFGAATLDESSPHFADQSPLFVRRELRPVWLDEADIRAHLEREYRPGE